MQMSGGKDLTADDADASGRDAEMPMDRKLGMEEPSSVAMDDVGSYFVGRKVEINEGKATSGAAKIWAVVASCSRPGRMRSCDARLLLTRPHTFP